MNTQKQASQKHTNTSSEPFILTAAQDPSKAREGNRGKAGHEAESLVPKMYQSPKTTYTAFACQHKTPPAGKKHQQARLMQTFRAQ
mmetsp:Transcript_26624/g.52459  ORF Transcript_26624/g.52459 Transcript_26624/m.52459 type:complete len:86 (+) Transcript_26624:1966-2223(+)